MGKRNWKDSDFDDFDKEYTGDKNWLLLIPVIIIGILLIALIGWLIHHRLANQETAAEAEISVEAMEETIPETKEDESSTETTSTDTEALEEEIKPDVEDPQENVTEQTGATSDVSAIVASGQGETAEITLGIDVAKYQGTIDWKAVATSGIDFAMIRVGYRTQTTGIITEDPTAKYNMQEATANGIKIGAYFFSTAISEAEAIEEADYVANMISKYAITYPVAYNCEGFNAATSRQNTLDQTSRTNIAIAFLKEIQNKGYTPMFYAAKNEMENDALWNTSGISGNYKIWVSQYPSTPYPQTAASSYSGTHAMWQYTNQGTIPGIGKSVDVNVAYFGYSGAANALSSEAPETVTANVEALMNFTEVNETVTAKDSVNLRDKPSQGSDSTVLATLHNGDQATRTGISSSGWSRVIIAGAKYYAVSSYLTTDLSYTTPQPVEAPAEPVVETPDQTDGIKTKFNAVNESVTPKIEVNLRTLPSVTNPDARVAATIKYGEWITRTGVSDNGWSKVEYNGQTLYAVSSYLSTAP